jgi:hypothetical protein
VSICDPAPPGKELRSEPRRFKRPGDKLITPDEAATFAREAIDEYQLLELPLGGEAFARAKAGRPVLVSALEYEDTFYYIVPFQLDRRSVSGHVLVDARFGDMWSAIGHPGGEPLIRLTPEDVRRQIVERKTPILHREALRERLIGEMYRLLADARRQRDESDLLERARLTIDAALADKTQLRVREEVLEVSQTLVWAATPVSPTPINAFYQVTAGRERFYVSALNGEVLTQLSQAFWPLGG